jgi:hypothetical protein
VLSVGKVNDIKHLGYIVSTAIGVCVCVCVCLLTVVQSLLRNWNSSILFRFICKVKNTSLQRKRIRRTSLAMKVGTPAQPAQLKV